MPQFLPVPLWVVLAQNQWVKSSNLKIVAVKRTSKKQVLLFPNTPFFTFVPIGKLGGWQLAATEFADRDFYVTFEPTNFIIL
jgi:hypothetical protein